jgi:DNA-binding NarL/FixJ family response regulator
MVVLGTAGTASEAHAAVRRGMPDVIVLDIALADAHGLELLQNLLGPDTSTRAVVFSMYDDRTYAERAIRSGAHGYVMKSAPTQSLLDAIRSARRSEFHLSAPVLSRILRSMSKGAVTHADQPFANLTDRELEVYQLLGHGMHVAGIAEQLNLSRKTVETYRRRIREKLELDSITELLQHAIQWTHTQSHT